MCVKTSNFIYMVDGIQRILCDFYAIKFSNNRFKCLNRKKRRIWNPSNREKYHAIKMVVIITHFNRLIFIPWTLLWLWKPLRCLYEEWPICLYWQGDCKRFRFPCARLTKKGNDDVTVLYCEKNTMDEWLFVNGVCDMID